MKNPIIILLSCLLLSCTNNNTETTVHDAHQILIDSIVLSDVDSDGALSYGRNKLGNLTISYFNSKRDYLHTYDIDDKRTNSLKIIPERAGREFYLADDTSLYVLNGKGNYITILKNGKYRYVYATPKDTLPATLSSTAMPFQVADGHVVLHKTLNYDIRTDAGRRAFFNSKLLRLYALKQDSLIEIASFGAFPTEYTSKFHYEIFPKSIFNHTSGEVYYVFNNSNAIYSFNIKTNGLRLNTVKRMQKNNQKNFEENNSDLSYVQKYLLENSQYYMMLYDDILNKIVVVQKIGIPATNAKGELSLFTDQPYQIYCINKKYEVEKIVRFENNKNHKFPFAYCHDGLLYVPARDIRLNNERNELTIYVYKIS